jgi:hypothetical protein
MTIIYRLRPEDERRDIGSIPGVPLRDLTEADLAELPEHLVASIAANRRLYEKVEPGDQPAVLGTPDEPADESATPTEETAVFRRGSATRIKRPSETK